MNQSFAKAGSNRSVFAQTYLAALKAVIDCQDEAAGGLLNQVKRLMKDSEQDADILKIKSDLAQYGLDGLYGDYKYGLPSAGPWIACEKLRGMIGRHITALGNEGDIAAYNEFAQKSAKLFKKPSGLIDAEPALRIA